MLGATTGRTKLGRRAVGFLLAAFAGLTARSGRASVVIPPENLGELARRSELVVLATAGEPWSEFRGQELVTVTPFVVVETVSGLAAPGDVLEVEVPGGEGEDGTALVIEGSPRFATGGLYLLPLAPAHDGRYQPPMLAYGILQHGDGPDGAVLRPLPEAGALWLLERPDGAPVEAVTVYRERALLNHLAAVAGGRRAWNAAQVQAADAAGLAPDQAPPSGCALLTASNGKPMRWKTFDSGKTVPVAATRGGDSTLPGGGLAELQQAIADWDGIPATSIALRYQGETDYRLSCSSSFDTPKANANVVVFSDPCRDLTDLSGCAGTVAYGGAWASGTHTWGGTSFNTIVSLYVVVNNGISCLSPGLLRSVLTHELGHGLGFGHSDDPTSVMYRYCGNPIGATDTGCAQYLYSAIGDKAPAAPTGVAASDGTSALGVQVSWNPVPGAAAYTVSRRAATDAGDTSEFGPLAATSFDDTEAVPGRRYLYTVRAHNAFGSSAPSAADEGYRAEPPRSVDLVAPATAPSGAAYTVTWTEVAAAVTYEVEEASEPTFAAPTVLTVSGTTATFTHTVDAPQTFFYRVRPRLATAAAGAAAPPSNVAATTVMPAGTVTGRVAARRVAGGNP